MFLLATCTCGCICISVLKQGNKVYEGNRRMFLCMYLSFLEQGNEGNRPGLQNCPTGRLYWI